MIINYILFRQRDSSARSIIYNRLKIIPNRYLRPWTSIRFAGSFQYGLRTKQLVNKPEPGPKTFHSCLQRRTICCSIAYTCAYRLVSYEKIDWN